MFYVLIYMYLLYTGNWTYTNKFKISVLVTVLQGGSPWNWDQIFSYRYYAFFCLVQT